MQHYLSIVPRGQFTLYYRFGYMYIPRVELLPFSGEVTSEVKQKIVDKFDSVTPFEYDEEYLILHFEKENVGSQEIVLFNIQELVAIYPLSQRARVSISSKIDPRIRLEEPILEPDLQEIESRIDRKELEKAIESLWTICNVKKDQASYMSPIIMEAIYQGLEHRRNGKKASLIQGGSLVEYLIAYDRHDYFPNSSLGYFYDTGLIFAYSKGYSTFDGSKLHLVLEALRESSPEIQLEEVIRKLEHDERTKPFISGMRLGEIQLYKVFPLFLVLRHELREADDPAETSLVKHLDYLKKFGDNFFYTLVLLGAFFGFKKFYDLYYEKMNLRFFKQWKGTDNVEEQNLDREIKVAEKARLAKKSRTKGVLTKGRRVNGRKKYKSSKESNWSIKSKRRKGRVDKKRPGRRYKD